MNLFEVMTGKMSRMSHVNRYSSFPVNRRENVAEHSWWVSMISFLIASDLREQGEVINLEAVLRYALFHDVSEVNSGDVIRSYKHRSPEILRAMEDADYESTHALLTGEEFKPCDWVAWDSWQFSKNKKALEGQIVSFADMAAVAFYCREEDRSGNRTIRTVLRDMYETWFSAYHDHPLLGQYIGQMFPDGRFADMLRETALSARTMHPIMSTRSEGPTAEHDWSADEGRDVSLG